MNPNLETFFRTSTILPETQTLAISGLKIGKKPMSVLDSATQKLICERILVNIIGQKKTLFLKFIVVVSPLLQLGTAKLISLGKNQVHIRSELYGRQIFIHTLLPVNRWSCRMYLLLWRAKMAIYMYPNPRVASTTNDGTVYKRL